MVYSSTRQATTVPQQGTPNACERAWEPGHARE